MDGGRPPSRRAARPARRPRSASARTIPAPPASSRSAWAMLPSTAWAGQASAADGEAGADAADVDAGAPGGPAGGSGCQWR
ncbi:MAG: hypothetical protein U0470_08275 [Anaerolineae bacterium]